MESLSEHEAMRVLQAAAALDAVRATGPRPNSLATGWSPSASQPQQQLPQSNGPEIGQFPAQGHGEDVWREMAETDGGELKRHGDLDTWTDVFRATAASVRDAWRHVECLSYESLAFGWLALARKHEPLQVAPTAAFREDLTATLAGSSNPAAAAWLGEAQWVQAAYQAAEGRERLAQTLGLQPSDLLAVQPESSGWRPAYFLAVHHDSRTVRLVVRGSGHLRDLLTHVAGHSSPLGPGFVHHGMLCAARQLLAEGGAAVASALAGHPGYGLHVLGHSLGAGTAALVAMLLTSPEPDPDPALTAPLRPLLGSPPAVRATCFGPPPVATAELGERCAAVVDSVVYNSDLVSRCSVLSLRRLANEMSAASEEVLARSELAQALRRGGALGLANHLVAAALCRCPPPQEAAASPHASPTGTTPLRPAGPEGLSLLTGALTRAPPAVPSPPPPNGRTPQLASLSCSPLKPPSNASASLLADALKAPSASGALASHQPASPSAPAPPVPAGPPNGILPPLVTAGAAATAGGGGAGRSLSDPLIRKATDSQGVLSPPPLVAAAAAASAQTASAAASVAAGPTPPRRGVVVALAPDTVRAAAGGAASVASTVLAPVVVNGGCGGGSSDDSGPAFRPWPESVTGSGNGNGGGNGGVLLEPLPSPPLVPAGGVVGAGVPGQRRDVMGPVDGLAVVNLGGGMPLLLPPLLLQGGGPSSDPKSQAQSPLASRQPSLRELPLPPPALLLPPVAVEQQQQQQSGGGEDGEKAWLAAAGEAGAAVGAAMDEAAQESGEGAGSPAAHSFHELVVPGSLYMIERRGADATASFRLLRDFGRKQLNRILLKRSMLRDHLLSHYIAALERVAQQH